MTSGELSRLTESVPARQSVCWGIWLLWATILGGFLALLVIALLFGRVPLWELFQSPSASLVIATVVVAAAV